MIDFRKQIEKKTDDAHANGELAIELQQAGHFDEAIGAYKRQIELAPSETV